MGSYLDARRPSHRVIDHPKGRTSQWNLGCRKLPLLDGSNSDV